MLKKEKAMSVVALTAKMRELSLSAQVNSPHNHFNIQSTLTYGTYFPVVFQKPARVTLYTNGNLIKVSREKPRILLGGRSRGGNRTRIKTFTWRARLRLMRRLATMDKKHLPLYVTLTYPAVYPTKPGEYKRHLKNFASRMKRSFPQAGFFWRLEFQKRGAPHYHLLVYGGEGTQDWVSAAWYDIVGSGEENHLKQGVFVARMENYRQMVNYVSKMSIPSDVEYCGRFWGSYHKENLKRYMSEVITYEITEKLACQLIRYFRKLSGVKSRAYPSLTIFGDGKFWAECIEKIIGRDKPHPRGELRAQVFRRDGCL